MSQRYLLSIRCGASRSIGCHIITVTNDIIAKLSLVGKDQDDYSLDTVQTFHRDATAAAYSIDIDGAVVQHKRARFV